MQDARRATIGARDAAPASRGLVLTASCRVRDASVAAMAAVGVDCSVVDTPSAAVACLAEGRYALVLCDDDVLRQKGVSTMARLREAAPLARMVHLLDSGSASLTEDLRHRLSEAVAWLPGFKARTSAPALVAGSRLGEALEQATPMAALHVDERDTILQANRVATVAGCAPGTALPSLASFPLTTWSLAESQAAHRRLVESAHSRADASDHGMATRLFALRATRLHDGSMLMSACEVADADAELNRAHQLLTPREERLQALESFAAGVTRELGNTLGVISGCAHLLRARFPRASEDPDLKTIIAPLEQAVAQASDLLARMRVFSVQGGMDVSSLDAVDILRDWSRALRASVLGEIAVEVEADRASCPVVGNRKALHEALMHLSTNAIDAVRAARRKHPLIRLRLHGDRIAGRQDAIALVIADNGTGIEASVRDRIFDPFFTLKSAGGSSGLGLTHVAHTARAHGGDVRVSSRVGEGCEFRLVLPLPGAGAADQVPEPARPRMVLVDSDRLTLEVTAHALRALGCRVVATTNLATAEDCCVGAAHEFDALLLDAGCGERAGVRLATAARASGIPRVIVLASATAAVGELIGAADRVLRRPVSAWDLLEVVRGFPTNAKPPGVQP